MKESISRTTGKKLVAEGKGNRAHAKLLKGKARKLIRNLDQAAEMCRSGSGSQAKVATPVGYFIGVDLGDRKSNYCVMDLGKEIRAESVLATTAEAFTALFSAMPRSRIALEVGTHSPWISALLEDLGHEVYVANPRKMESIRKNKRKNDKTDARKLARLVRADPELLYPIRHRGVKARQALVLVRARDAAIRSRTLLINSVRGLVKSVGGRVPKCDGKYFHKHAEGALPQGIREALLPLVKQIAALTAVIHTYDRRVERMAAEEYPESELLRQVKGIGALTALTYMLTLERPERFAKSREVGPYLGLVPKQDDSGETTKQLRITKTGDQMVRRLLIGSAQYILGPFGEDSDLRRFGLKLAARGGRNAKKRAVTAVARKLGVLLHRLWVTAEEYEPLRNTRLREEALAAVING